eukprot:535967_1
MATLGIISLLIQVSHQQTFHTYNCAQAQTNCNTEIILPDTGGTDSYTFNCYSGDCTNLILYIGDKGSLIVNCWEGSSCVDMEVYVGKFDPPGSTDASNMNDQMSATVYCSASAACQNVLLACKGTGMLGCSLWADSGSN